jgi:hypothetical protein
MEGFERLQAEPDSYRSCCRTLRIASGDWSTARAGFRRRER